MKDKKIVILGAGFGGMYAFKSLSKELFSSNKVILVDKKNHFLFTPLLHEVATGSLGPQQVVEPIRSLICSDTEFIQSSIQSIDTDKKTITTSAKKISYDILISSLGSQSYYYNITGAQEYTYTLKTLEDAVVLKNQFIKKFEQAAQETNFEKRKKILSFVIVGAGPTGVELAGEAADLFFDTFEKYYNDMYCIHDVSLILVNSTERVLGMFNEKLGKYATRRLSKHHVDVRNNIRIVEVRKNSLIADTGEEIFAETIIWTAGVSAQRLITEKPVFQLEKGCIVVDEYMRAKGLDDVYIIGDMAHCLDNNGKAYPMTAQVAKQQGMLVGENINNEYFSKPQKPFKYRERGMLASLGNYDAVAFISGISFFGLTAWFMWRTIYLFNFISWRKRLKIMLDWTINLFTERDISHL